MRGVTFFSSRSGHSDLRTASDSSIPQALLPAQSEPRQSHHEDATKNARAR